jgi:hypothetical protein
MIGSGLLALEERLWEVLFFQCIESLLFIVKKG